MIIFVSGHEEPVPSGCNRFHDLRFLRARHEEPVPSGCNGFHDLSFGGFCLRPRWPLARPKRMPPAFFRAPARARGNVPMAARTPSCRAPLTRYSLSPCTSITHPRHAAPPLRPRWPPARPQRMPSCRARPRRGFAQPPTPLGCGRAAGVYTALIYTGATVKCPPAFRGRPRLRWGMPNYFVTIATHSHRLPLMCC